MSARRSPMEVKARERMKLVAPETAWKILGHDRYWTRQFVALYRQRCDDLMVEAPREAARLAEPLPILVERIRTDDGPGSFDSRHTKRSQLALAYVVREHCRWFVGREDEAAEDRREIDRLFRLGVSDEVAIEDLMRQAVRAISADPPNPAAALDTLSHAARLGCQSKTLELPSLREVLYLRGLVRQRLGTSGLGDLTLALVLVEDVGREKGRGQIERIGRACDYDLLRFTPRIADLQHLVAASRQLKRRLAPQPKSPAKCRLYWLAGLASSALGLGRWSVRQLTKARDGYRALQRPVELAMVTLDLACEIRADDRPQDAEQLVSQLVGDLESLGAPRAVHEAVSPWREEPPLDGAGLQEIKASCWVRLLTVDAGDPR